MREIVVQIPADDADQNIEIEVKINGRKKKLQYRVEIVGWDVPHPSSEAKINVLRRVIKEHDKDWQLMTIGAPSDSSIPVMFRKKDTSRSS